MAPEIIPLSDGFAPASREAWLGLVAKTLKGSTLDSLVGRTIDGLPIRPLYTAADVSPAPPFIPARRQGSRPWDIRAVVSHADPATANSQALEALAGGAASLLLSLGDGHSAGIRLDGADALARVLEGVMTDVAPVALDAGFLGPLAAQWLGAAARSAPGAPLVVHLDPLSAFAVSGVSPGTIDAHLGKAAATARDLWETYPRASLFLASGRAVHEAGGSAAWELAFALASALAYAKALVLAGVEVEPAFARVALGLAVDAEPLGAIAKLRAARVVWTRMTGACGVTVPARIEARSSRRMLTRADRWTNLVRLTSAGFAAAVGGADAIVLGAFSDAIAPPDAFALRMARNTQLVLMEEAHLGKVVDPAAWAAFNEIEATGGALAALGSGLVSRAVEAGRAALSAALAARDARIIGVTDFAPDEPPPPAEVDAPWSPPQARLPGDDSRCPPLGAIRLEELVQ